ncbi:nicotinamidase [Ameyamaea chiangmaiensis NBRC 103196]|uniref:nicotinamidase n=1 Tax=Ameyamaea chiangmaiensis TaxID=442969 RepID=A0A850PK23_9PROT|nr:nicotinamidase [Ameyamaea chiangmaiensis]MBS4074813.1 nicotinamidase [Ameyamaea chiangmaiensis]NVN41651.1 nicotinamidase [Ameyamaea chiangmaiensis]GBQ62820.1 nicotinamidase [Ameyamaea chiangmaiensis NBRC 103196]
MTRSGRSALIIVDMQIDFMPGGALAIAEGDRLVPSINTLAHAGFGAVVATKDWHPADHCSFRDHGGPWPAHCIAGSRGADLCPGLDPRPVTHVLHKGLHADCDSYSAFFDNDHVRSTGLTGLLRDLSVDHVVVCGVALDYCVAATARDAVAEGFRTTVASYACRGVAPDPTAALAALREGGVEIVGSAA